MPSSVIAAPSSNNAASATPSPTETSTETTSSETSITPTESPSPTSTSSTSTESSTPSASSSTPTSASASSTSETPTTTSSSESSSSSDVVTTIVTQSSSSGSTADATTVIVTSTEASPSQTGGNTADDSSATSGGQTGITSSSNDDSGLSAGGTIAVAVVVPVVSVAIIILAALYFWRKWKGKKAAEEERRKEVEEYGFNPNNDPSLPPVAMGAAPLEQQEDTSGYRGWGTTSAGRKASTNLSSGAGVGLAMSEASGYHHATTPSEGTVQYSDGQGQQASGEDETIGVLGAAPVAANNRASDIRRGPSNASSAYSVANRSEASDESHMSATHPTAPFYEDNPYSNEMQTQYGGYGDSPYGNAQPVIRDVQARRNTRIESPAVFPRQGNAGIAQNF